MSFASIIFIYVFLLLCLACYYIIPNKENNIKYKNNILLIFSLLFYSSEKMSFLILMMCCLFLTYINGLLIKKNNKLIFVESIIVSILPLFYFKYTNFFIENINLVFNVNIPIKTMILPLGISFYTFQMISYLIDVQRKKIEAETKFLNLALYICFFPQLVAGPIVTYSQIKEQILKRIHSLDRFNQGIFCFLIGLNKKILIANQFGEFCNLYNYENTTILFTWLYGIAYSLQVYFDFSGYSDMAIGLGRMFGFELPINFNYPYIANSIQDFWKRWHITLSSFFKEYIYIPLGGNRKGNIRTIINLFIVWTLTGFWHGANWNFILWGIYFYVLLMIEKFFIKININKILKHIVILFLLMISFIIFGSNELSFVYTIKNLFIGNFINDITIFYFIDYFSLFLIGIIGATPFPKLIYNKIKKTKYGESFSFVIEPIFILSSLTLITAYLVNGSFNPFLYFRF